MAAFDKDKVIRGLAPDEVKAIRAWRKGFTAKVNAADLKNLQALSDVADTLWQQHLRERRALLARSREPVPVWGQPDPPQEGTRLTVAVSALRPRLPLWLYFYVQARLHERTTFAFLRQILRGWSKRAETSGEPG